jgi:ribonuclease III
LEADIIETVQGEYQDYKSRLQEMVQARSKDKIYYQILEEDGPAHAKSFIAGVFFQQELLASGQGKSKKEAEQNAAGKALKNGSFWKRL